MHKLKLALLFCLCLVGMHAPLAADDWTEDIKGALETARKEKKDLLLLFTGSDWCPPCIKLETEVLSDPNFLREIKSTHVLVKLDFPQSTPQDEKTKKQNQEWQQRYGVDGYPTIVMVDQNERPYGITGYESGGVENYLGLLEELHQARIRRDEFLEQADKVEGLERAKLLDQAMSELNEELVFVYYEDTIKEIVDLDKNDDMGLRSKWNEAKDNEIRKIIITDILLITRLETAERALQYIDEVLGAVTFPPDQKMQVLQVKLNLLQKLRQMDKVYALLDQMIEIEGVEGTVRERLIVKKVLLTAGSGDRDKAMKLLDDTLAQGGDNLFLWLAKGELLDAEDKFELAIAAYDSAIPKAGFNPDLLADLIGAKADALMELDQGQKALQELDNFADDTQMPSDLRSEVLLHKAMILRDQGRRRLAILAENRAVEIAQSPMERTEMQKVVERLRKRYENDQ